MTTKILFVHRAEPVSIRFEEAYAPAGNSGRIYQRVPHWDGPVRAEVVLTHGLGEHSERYQHVAEAFAGHGFRLRTYDLHGHGRSSGTRGDAANYEIFLDNLERVLEGAKTEDRPLFLMGHSFGAQVTLNFLDRRKCACRGAVIASPWLRLAFRPPFWRVTLAQLMLRVWPAFRQHTPHDQLRLSRDLEHLEALPGKDLMHHRLSARLYFTLVREGAAALAAAPRLRLPLFLLHGGDDPVTSLTATSEFFDQVASADKSFTVYPHARHETLNDLCRSQVMRDMAAWIETRLGGSPEDTPV